MNKSILIALCVFAAIITGCSKQNDTSSKPSAEGKTETVAKQVADQFEKMSEKPKVVNTKCPIMGSPIDPENVPDSLYRQFKGQGVGFCCGGCPDQWDKLSDTEKAEKLAASMGK